MNAKPIPNPGSPEASEQGCLCPTMDNAYGRGYFGGIKGKDGKPIFVIVQGCPLHDPEEKRE